LKALFKDCKASAFDVDGRSRLCGKLGTLCRASAAYFSKGNSGMFFLSFYSYARSFSGLNLEGEP
jgi:hypothetical protein